MCALEPPSACASRVLRSPAMAEEAAKEFQSQLTRPTLLKSMLKSHVTGGFWLGGFGNWRAELPTRDLDMALEHRGEHWPARWKCDNPGFSGGWRTFSIAQKLMEGDCLVFEKKNDTTLKVYIFRTADYADGTEPEQDAYFEDAAAVDFKGRKIASQLPAAKEVKLPKRPAAKEEGDRDDQAPTAKRPRSNPKQADAAEAGPSSSGEGKGVKPKARHGRAADRNASGHGAAGVAEDVPLSPSASGGAARRVDVAGEEDKGRRNPSRPGRPPPGALKVTTLPITRETDSPSRPVAKPKAVRKPEASNVGGDKTRAPRKESQPNDPAQPRGVKKPKKSTIWDYEFPDGKMAEMAEMLKALHADICSDGVLVDKKTGDIVGDWRDGMVVHGYKKNLWLLEDGRYRPIHCLFSPSRR